MIIDVHLHPILYGAINEDAKRLAFRKQNFGLYKSAVAPMEHALCVMAHAGVDKSVLLPEDYSYTMGQPIISNEEIKTLIDYAPEKFIGFASVDPREEGAAQKLSYAFDVLGLKGLKLNLSHLKMYPDDQRLIPLYALCDKQQKPILFHAGYSWEPDSPAKYARPILYEDVAVEYPHLRFALAHLGWPWVDETVMMILKYENVYTDTATVFMDSPANYYEQIFLKNMGPNFLSNNFADKVMFGSNHPRFRQARVREGLEKLRLRKDVFDRLMGGNALRFLGMEEAKQHGD